MQGEWPCGGYVCVGEWAVCLALGWFKCFLQGPPQQTATFPRIMLLIMMPADFSSQLIFLPFVSNSNTLPFSQNFQEQFAVHSAQFVGEGMVEMSPEGEQNLSLSF